MTRAVGPGLRAVARAERYWAAGGQTVGGQLAWKRTVATQVAPPGTRVLDVGCGAGDSSPQGAVGLDASPSALRSAAARGVRAVLSDVEDAWPIADRSIDVVLLFDVLEHVPDPTALLAEADRVLVGGGRMLAAIPNAAHVVNRAAALAGRTTDFTDAAHRQGDVVSDHLHRFSLGSAMRLLDGTGWRVVRRFDWAPREFSEGRWPALSLVAGWLHTSGTLRRLPGLLAYEFLFVCAKANE